MPIRDYQCRSCGSRFEYLELRDDDLPGCPGCGEHGAERLASGFAIKMGNGPMSITRSNWDQYDSATLDTAAGSKEAAYEVAREGGLSKIKADEVASKASDDMRSAGARLIAAQESAGQRDAFTSESP